MFGVCAAIVLFLAGAGLAAVVFSRIAPTECGSASVAASQRLIGRPKKIVAVYTKLKSVGGSSNVEVLVATRDMLWDELDTLAMKAERIAVLERILSHEKESTAFFELTPDFQEVERLLLRVRLFDAEITLELEKLK